MVELSESHLTLINNRLIEYETMIHLVSLPSDNARHPRQWAAVLTCGDMDAHLVLRRMHATTCDISPSTTKAPLVPITAASAIPAHVSVARVHTV